MGSDAFDAIAESIDTALIVVTAAADDSRAGCVVGFHAQSSIDPQRYSIWLSKANHTYRIAMRATHLGIHFLTADDLGLAKRFGTLTGDDVDKFADIAVSVGNGGVPVLDACPNRMIGRRTAVLDEGGDHVCIATEIVSAHGGGRFEPLRLSQACDLEPGHDASDYLDGATETLDRPRQL
jgi:flavin reductase (DIM6/NTAB) family NADH-FMN oxidoreductase RutF